MKSSSWKLAGLAVALGVATWLLAPILLTPKLPDDFPKLPDLHAVNPSMAEVLRAADRDARRNPGSTEVVGKLGMAYHANLFLEQAAQAYRIAARLAPGGYRWAYAQAVLAEENGNEPEETHQLQQTLHLKPDHVPALVKLADASFKLDRLDDAAHDYESALQAPGNAASLQANFGLARVAARRKDWKQVVAYAAPLARAYPGLLPPYELLAEGYQALNQPAQADGARQGALAAKSKTVPPLDDPFVQQLTDVCYSSTRLLKQAGVLSHQGYPDRALQLARRAAQAEPNDPDVRNFIAHTLIASYPGKPDAVSEALTQLREAIRLRPDDPTPLWMFSRDFFDVPEPPAAVQQMSDMMQPFAGRPDAHLYLGLVAGAQGQMREAISQYHAALAGDPNNAGLYSQLGIALAKSGQLDEAIANLQHSVALNPADINTRFNLGAVLLEHGQNAQALKELTEVLRLKPDYAAAHFCMAFAYLYAKRLDDAVARFREGLRYGPDDAEAHYGLATALAAEHKRADALPELREALRLKPDYTEAQQLLRQLEQ